MRVVLGLYLFVQSAGLLADEQGKPAVPVSEMTGQLLQLLFGLLLVIALIFLLAWVARRIQTNLPMRSNQDSIRLIATQPLGPRERLLLVQVGKEQVLLGLTPGTIAPLHVLQEPVELTDNGQQSAEFGKRLKRFLQPQDNAEESK